MFSIRKHFLIYYQISLFYFLIVTLCDVNSNQDSSDDVNLFLFDWFSDLENIERCIYVYEYIFFRILRIVIIIICTMYYCVAIKLHIRVEQSTTVPRVVEFI